MRSLAVYLNETRIGTLHEADDLWNFEYEVVRGIQTDNAALPEGSKRFLAGEIRLLDAIRHIVTSEILRKIPSPSG